MSSSTIDKGRTRSVQDSFTGGLCRIIAAKTMNASSGGGGGRAKIDIFCRCPVGIQGSNGPGIKLRQILEAAVDIPPHIVWIVLFHGRCRKDAFCQDHLPESRCVTFDLVFNERRHIRGRSMGDMAIGPCRMSAGRCARGIEKTLLGKDDIRRGRLFPALTSRIEAAISSREPPR